MKTIDFHLILEKYTNLALNFAPRLVLAIIVFVIGLWVCGWIARLVRKAMIRKEVDITLQTFLGSLISVSLKILLLITVAGMLGIQTTSFVAILGAMGLAVGLALQGSLSNFAGGMLTLVFKPYKVGDVIESQGQTGTVKEIQIFNTILLTADNKTVILPNGAVSNNTIVNHSKAGQLRVDIVITVSPTVDINYVKEVMEVIYAQEPLVLKDPKATTSILKLGDGMVTLAIRPYAATEDYWTVYFSIMDKIKYSFEEKGIEAPIPHRVVLTKSAPTAVK